MDKNKGKMKLSDELLDQVTGGVGNGGTYRTVMLSSFSVNDLNYFLQNQCPNPSCRKTLTKNGGMPCCDSCMVIYIQ